MGFCPVFIDTSKITLDFPQSGSFGRVYGGKESPPLEMIVIYNDRNMKNKAKGFYLNVTVSSVES